jgi:hypothetical protein
MAERIIFIPPKKELYTCRVVVGKVLNGTQHAGFFYSLKT